MNGIESGYMPESEEKDDNIEISDQVPEQKEDKYEDIINKMEIEVNKIKSTNPELYDKICETFDFETLRNISEVEDKKMQEEHFESVRDELLTYLPQNEDKKVYTNKLQPAIVGLLLLIQFMSMNPSVVMGGERKQSVNYTNQTSENLLNEEYLTLNEYEKSIISSFHKGPALPKASPSANKYFDNSNQIDTINFPISVTDAKKNPSDKNIFCLYKKEKDKHALYAYKNKNDMRKILETEASFMSFSPSGKYVALFNPSKKYTEIYNLENNNIVQTIKNELIIPYDKMSWSKDESKIYYSQAVKRVDDKSRELKQLGFYSDIKEKDIKSGKVRTIINGEKTNLADPNDMTIDQESNTIFIKTNQNKNIYKIKIK